MNASDTSMVPSKELHTNNCRGNLVAFVSIAILVLSANLLLWHAGPGVNWGLYAGVITLLVLLNRKTVVWDRTLIVLLLMLFLSGLQTARFLSLASFLVLNTLLFSIFGHTTFASLQPAWTRVFQAVLAPLNWIGVWKTIEQSKRNRTEGERVPMGRRFQSTFRILIPALLIVPVFLVLLSVGNAVMGSMVEQGIDSVFRWLSIDWIHPDWIIFTGAIAFTGLIFLRPGEAVESFQLLTKPWPLAGIREANIRCLQWLVLLVSLNLLFGFSTILDVVFLWFSKTLPEGVNHSRYVHEGVYVLIFTTVLSAGLLALLTQHTAAVRNHRFIRALGFLWIAQNALLISGVYLRLYLYIDAYGYTPKRVYVACFLVLELVGFALLLGSFLKRKGLQWLIGGNLVALFLYFFLLQFWNVNGTIVDRNIELFRKGEIPVPEERLIRELGSEGVRYIDLLIDSVTSADEVIQLRVLKGVSDFYLSGQLDHDWRAFQWRRARNLEIYRNLELKMEALELRLGVPSEGTEEIIDNGSDSDTTGHP